MQGQLRVEHTDVGAIARLLWACILSPRTRLGISMPSVGHPAGRQWNRAPSLYLYFAFLARRDLNEQLPGPKERNLLCLPILNTGS